MDRAHIKPLLALLLAAFLLPACYAGENEASSEDTPIELGSGPTVVQGDTLPASLARRLAEAADGYRTGLPVWIVADSRYPHEVQGVYGSEATADSARLIFAPDYGVYGPYRTEIDFGRGSVPVLRWCKRYDSTWCEEPGKAAVERDSVLTMSLLMVLVNGDTLAYDFDPDSVEAFFFTVSAIDRLVIPYYVRLNGLEWTMEFRDSLRAAIGRDVP